MGRYDGEVSGNDNEDPQHAVDIAYDFYMGKYEVTQAQWLALMGAWPVSPPTYSFGVGENRPVYYIPWNSAQGFVMALNNHIAATGQGPLTVRLPSEAEWEYACRTGTQTRFYFGDSPSAYDVCGDYAAGTLPGNRTDYMWYCGNNYLVSGVKSAGGKLPNAFGLFDMHGNAWEWCEDDWHAYYTGAPADGGAWVDAPRATYRVLRGGGWDDTGRECRSARRKYMSPSSASGYNTGFRVAAED